MTPHISIAPTDEIRTHFPALERCHGGRPVAYFDGPGGTQVPRAVADAMVDYLFHHNANTHWDYPTSVETDQAILAARGALADFLNASPTEIAFGANMTTLTFHLARAIGRELGRGDEIVVTELDHHANVAPWTALAVERGVRVRTVRMIPETGQLDLEDLARCVTSRTRVLAIGAASNALGTITDVREAAGIARAVGAVLFVDAVHSAAHAPVDVRAIACDFLACSAYKFYGPHVGVFYGRGDLLAALDVPKLIPAPDDAPERLETGTQNQEGIVGAAAAVNWLAGVARPAAGGAAGSRRGSLVAVLDAVHARNAALFARLWGELSDIRGVRLYGPPPSEPRTPTLAFTVNGKSAVEVARHLVRHAIFASHGDFYAATVVERLGLARDGLVRAGLACYTTAEEVDRLIAGVRDIAGK